mmetsp:Transcript_7751/g.21577  ORF Transcript_7751/g.21577 Transcript_7751/m.21577 type:complete len:112 (+) Transcript_7751:30-365(+)
MAVHIYLPVRQVSGPRSPSIRLRVDLGERRMAADGVVGGADGAENAKFRLHDYSRISTSVFVPPSADGYPARSSPSDPPELVPNRSSGVGLVGLVMGGDEVMAAEKSRGRT